MLFVGVCVCFYVNPGDIVDGWPCWKNCPSGGASEQCKLGGDRYIMSLTSPFIYIYLGQLEHISAWVSSSC